MDTGSTSKISLTATTGNNEISSGNNGIDQRGSQSITLRAGGANIITGGVAKDTDGGNQGDGIRIQNSGSVAVTGSYNQIFGFDEGLYVHADADAEEGIKITANNANENGFGNIISGDDNGIESAGTAGIDVSAVSGSNKIYGKNSAILNSGSGTIMITAGQRPDESGISLLANYEGFDNLIGVAEDGTYSVNGIESDGTGLTDVYAFHDNTIFGTENGILSSDTGTIKVVAENNNIIGQYTDESGSVFTSQTGINVQSGTVEITSKEGTVNIYGTSHGINNVADDNSNISVNANGDINILSQGYGIRSEGKNDNSQTNITTLTSRSGSNYITVNLSDSGYGISSTYADVSLKAYQDNVITLNAESSGIRSRGGNVELIADIGSNKVTANGTGNTSWGVDAENGGKVTLNAAISNEVSGVYTGIISQSPYSEAETSVILTAGSNKVTANGVGVQACLAGSVSITASSGDNVVKGNNGKLLSVGLTTERNDKISPKEDSGSITLSASGNNEVTASNIGIDSQTNGTITLTANNSNIISGQDYSVSSYKNSETTITAINGNNLFSSQGGEESIALDSERDSILTVKSQFSNNYVVSDFIGAYSANNSSITMNAGNSNAITAASKNIEDKGEFGTSYAIRAESGSSVVLAAENINQLLGSVYSNGADTGIFVGNIDRSASKQNIVQSYSYIEDAGDLNSTKEEGEADTNVISALYAEEGAEISLVGDNNILRTYAVSSSDDLERVIWAYQGSETDTATSINIKGYTDIATDNYQLSTNSKDIAVASGTATNLEELGAEAIRNYDGVRSEVVIEYADDGTAKSKITGDILSAYAGSVDIGAADGDSSSGISITGNLLAGNNGVLNVDLGNGGTLTGRADDYQDADTGVENNKADGEGSYFNPAFSSSILTSGTVKLAMGGSSKWNVTGQSWISSITTGASGVYSDTLPEINLTTYYNSEDGEVTTPKDGGQALTVGSITGDAIFTMNLDGNNVSNGNMLYMKQADGNYYINLTDAVAESEINNGHDGLRFATVGTGSDVTFYVGSRDGGAFNVEYEVGTDLYAQNQENDLYNGTELNNSKPGSDTVDAIFSEGQTNRLAKVALLSTEAVDEASSDAGYSQTVDEETTNFKIIAVKNREISDGGKTIINMSRANYANAVYMDTLNKRQGEARFVGDTDHGVWVRLRHDNIGKEDSFRSHNTMVEVGIDQRDVHDYGEFHTGVALDYMNGSLDYHTVDGDGDIERYGIWFYTTYLGNDGQYADLILKYGHLKNDFGFNTKTQGEHVTGDYTNETASLSAEYGWKFSNSHNYYIEPQAQLQYTYITGADYTTSQGSKVELNSIHSLIGRVGFRSGKDFLDWEHPATFYLRADALHEFLGDQDIRAFDDTGVMDITYENDDTWYTVGLGMTVKSSENTYFFIEGETALGADNEDTYTVSGGFRHSF